MTKQLKLIQNSLAIQTQLNEETGEKKITAIASNVNTVNDNNFYLAGDVIEIQRDLYPFLYEHGKQSSELIGDTHVYYDPEANVYKADLFPYDTALNIKNALERGAFSDVSIAYLVDDYEIVENGIIYVKHAILREVSLVMTGADKDAKISKNSVSDELEKERIDLKKKKKELKELKAKYE